MLRLAARELLRREQREAARLISHQSPRSPLLPPPLAAFSTTSKAAAADPEHVEDTPPVDAPPLSPPPLDFNSPWEAYRMKTNSELIRSILVFRACGFPWLVNNADTLLRKSKAVFGSTLVNWVLEQTFYKQFVAGKDALDIRPTLHRLQQAGVGAVLDYAAEDDVEAEEGPASRQQPTVIGRTYKYEDEQACDRRMANFLTSIDAARSPDEHSSSGYTAIKVTALGMPKLLERVSTALLAVRALFSQLDENGDGFIHADEFSRVYARLFTDSDEARMKEVFDYLDTDHDGRVDYIAFTSKVTVYDGATIAGRCREQGPFARAALTAEELQLLNNMVKRVNTLAEAAAASGVRLLVDAEHSYFQPAIDAVVAQLQRQHNIDEPRIYNTYQCYLKDVHDRITVDLERANREGYKFGAKLVRGAYMILERKRAKDLKLPSPIWDTKEDTDLAYDAAVAALLPSVRDNGAEIMVASHNQQSVEKTVAGMAALGLPPSSKVTFGQLLGMADHLTFTLGAHKYGAYKYTPFGGVDEVMPYLLRRAQENSDILGGVGIELNHLQNELKRRVFTG
jgi:proline dehydrogenase